MSAIDLYGQVAQLQKELADLKGNGRSTEQFATIETTEVDALAHCPLVLCPGQAQRPVRALLEHRTETCRDRARGDTGNSFEGSIIGGHVENTWTYLRMEHEADKYCEHCGRMLTITQQVRVEYPPISGHDPNALAKRLKGQLPDWEEPGGKLGDDALKQTVARLEGRIEAMLAMAGGQPINADTLVAAGADAFEAANETQPAKLPKGLRQRGDRFEALLYKSESADGKQHGLGIFDSLEEAEAERAAGLARAEAARAAEGAE